MDSLYYNQVHKGVNGNGQFQQTSEVGLACVSGRKWKEVFNSILYFGVALLMSRAWPRYSILLDKVLRENIFRL